MTAADALERDQALAATRRDADQIAAIVEIAPQLEGDQLCRALRGYADEMRLRARAEAFDCAAEDVAAVAREEGAQRG